MLALVTAALAAPPNQFALDQTGRETTLEYSWVKGGVGFSFGLRNAFTDGDEEDLYYMPGVEFIPVAKVGVVFERRLSDHWAVRTGLATPGPTYSLGIVALGAIAQDIIPPIAFAEVPLLVSYRFGDAETFAVTGGFRTQPFLIADSIERGDTMDLVENIGPTVGIAVRF